jgi:hypothetical protein
MRAFLKSIAVSGWLCSLVSAAAAQTTVAGATLSQNVRIYDGTGTSLSAPSNVLVRGNRIERISRAPIRSWRRPCRPGWEAGRANTPFMRPICSYQATLRPGRSGSGRSPSRM